VFDLELLDTDQVKDIEPNVFAIKALLSPSTGIIDTHSLMKHFEATAIKNGVDFAYKSQVKDIRKAGEGYDIDIIDADDMPYTFSTAMLINCSGLEAVGIADMLGVNQGQYNMYFCKGEYFRINPPHNRKVGRLVYPVPFERLVGLGIHATTDLGGGLKLGPNAIYLDKNVYDYSIDVSHLDDFYASAKKFLPFLEKEHLSPDSAGLRPKIQGPGQASRDFIIRKETDKGHPRFINLIGIESPGLTSSMAIAEYVETLARE
jgi:L-2-hydroxyglutarate oxidase LhgO